MAFGQPIYETHPHLIQPGEISPGITAQEYYERRIRLSSLLRPKSAAILIGSDVKYRAGNVFYEFHQDPNFFYLTGFDEPDSLMVIENISSKCSFHLFVRPKDPKAELWDGSRTGVEAAIEIFNADASGSSATMPGLEKLISSSENIYLNQTDTRDSSFSLFTGPKTFSGGKIHQMVRNKAIYNIGPIVESLRTIKSSAEIDVMHKASRMSAKAYNDAYKTKFTKESDLYAFLEYRFKIEGCDRSGYVPVVAGGTNALQIHYTKNYDVLRDEDLVLVDAGGQLGYYCADISRTWPVGGKFSAAQKDLYEAILSVNKDCIKLGSEASKFSLNEIHHYSVELMDIALKNIGINVSRSTLARLYPHHVGHYLGLEVHDTPSVSRSNPLKAGQVITIEPGIYVPENDPDVPSAYHGIGIRIEDNVCVGTKQPFVLTSAALKEVSDIENVLNE
ncbi:hypothetical protein CANCADRAFT_26013 [Tortispora caseinolytica NRRL Y-17796]|uniref:Aminopeptidase P N-terminal domain-containing protein n=1 Tax=Tortispora caseinolytica NRRL Y-17796 TaxID=767744 RepID=A0A1E4TEX9_9ASCO|nr:hypothetical protein CANCADRAFT_26013 [Tortispora caseinolytica NRRL Y-17796]